ncbi:MAG: MarR family transcriptional regulator [Actinomycetota bacterium]|nr:MarR family transcriptional regulator [Actinomycetota bacterium]
MPPTDDRVAAWRWLLLAHAAALRAIEEDLSSAGTIPLSWYDVLLELNAAQERRLRMTELAERVVLSRTRVSRLVDELVRKDLVERIPDPDDGRAAFATITRRGRDELRRAAPHYLAGIERHFTSLLADHEREVVAGALERVANHHRQLIRR